MLRSATRGPSASDFAKAKASSCSLSSATILFTTFQKEITGFREVLQAEIDLNNRGAGTAVDTGAATYVSALFWVIGTLIVAVLIFVAMRDDELDRRPGEIP